VHLNLFQHGAARREAEAAQRGLTDEGRHTVERMAEFLAALGLALDRIEHSEKLRARQKAEILASHLRPVKGTRQLPASLQDR
jgi:phosphohistidine phosphatase